jgi:tetratricopeptide (TPR) repeat protein
MKQSALWAFPLLFLISSPGRAQQTTPPTPQASTDSAAAPAAAMSPRQVAEMRADIMMARKEYKEAAGAYGQLLENEPPNAVLLNKIGVAYQQLGELRNAEKYYKKAVKADHSLASAINNIGTVEYEKNHYGKAVNYYKKALAQRTDMATIYSNLGYAYFADKQYPEAMNSFGKALALDPDIFERKGGGVGSIVQQRTTTDPGLFYFFVAKAYALTGDAEHAAHYLKLARDDGYKQFQTAQSDPSFARVIKDPRVQEVLRVPPSYAVAPK